MQLEQSMVLPDREAPPITELEQKAIDEWLQFMLDRMELAYNNIRVAYMESPSSALKGQVAYLQHRVGTLKWLIAVNMQRKCNG